MVLKKNKDLLKKAYNKCERILGKNPFKVNQVSLFIHNSRKEFNKIWRKFHKRDSDKHEVGFVVPSKIYRRILLKKKFEIHILSKKAFDLESDFDRSYFFKVLVHEMSHIFLYHAEYLKDVGELTCYYVANQKKFHEKEYRLGKRLMRIVKNVR